LQVSNNPSRTRTYFDLPAFHAALDAERQVRGLSWRQLGAEAGVAPSTLTRMGHGRHPDVDGLSALLAWANLPAELFIRASRRASERPETLVVVSSQLHSDPRLSHRDAAAISELVRVSYERLQRDPDPADASELGAGNH